MNRFPGRYFGVPASALGLPWLEAMSRLPQAHIGGAGSPRSHGCAVHAERRQFSAWYPEGTGRDFTLSPTLAAAAGSQERHRRAENLWNAASKGGDGHYVKEAAILTCTTIKKTPGADIGNGVSMDQVAAQRIGHETPLPSLELGISPVAIGVDAVVGYTRVYGSHIAWSSPTTPLAREINPRSVYERLFRASSGPQGNGAKMDTLLLDRVLGDAKRLRTQVGAQDQIRLDEYLSLMRSLEERRAARQRSAQKTLEAARADQWQSAANGSPNDHAEHVRLMLDMIATAFQSDTTRIATFMFGNAVSNVSFRFLEGVSAGHHDISHHQKDADKLRQYQLINKWHVEQYAYLLRKLRVDERRRFERARQLDGPFQFGAE